MKTEYEYELDYTGGDCQGWKRTYPISKEEKQRRKEQSKQTCPKCGAHLQPAARGGFMNFFTCGTEKFGPSCYGKVGYHYTDKCRISELEQKVIELEKKLSDKNK